MYDKSGGVPRLEATINDPTDFKTYRPKEGQPRSKSDWLPMRRGEGALNGFRNRDLRAQIHPGPCSPEQTRRRAARVTRQLRMLRAHGLIRKIPRTHRYILTQKGRQLTTAFLRAKTITTGMRRLSRAD